MEYEIKPCLTSNGEQKLLFICNEESGNIDLLFNDDLLVFPDYIAEAFEKVVYGGSPFEEITGNVCSLEITPETTKIFNMLSGAPEDFCQIETTELCGLMKIWLEKAAEFYENQ